MTDRKDEKGGADSKAARFAEAKHTKGINVRMEGEAVVIEVLDRSLNFWTTVELKPVIVGALKKHLAEGCRLFVMDLTRVKIIDSCGVACGFIIPRNTVSEGQGAEIWFAIQTPFIITILEILRIKPHVSLCATVEDALRGEALR